MTRDVVTGAWREVSPEWRERERERERERAVRSRAGASLSQPPVLRVLRVKTVVRVEREASGVNVISHSEEACCQIVL